MDEERFKIKRKTMARRIWTEFQARKTNEIYLFKNTLNVLNLAHRDHAE